MTLLFWIVMLTEARLMFQMWWNWWMVIIWLNCDDFWILMGIKNIMMDAEKDEREIMGGRDERWIDERQLGGDTNNQVSF